KNFYVLGVGEIVGLKKEYKQKNEKIEEKIFKKYTTKTKEKKNQHKLNKALDIVQKVSKIYIYGEIEKKRTLIGSIFPEKLEFDGTQYRTARINSVFASIFQINNELRKNKNRKNDHFNHFSCLVPEVGIEPTLRRTRV